MKQPKTTSLAAIVAVLSISATLAGTGCAPTNTTEVVEAAQTEYRTLTLAAYEDKVAGGWLGQAIGVLFGAPTEFCGRER